MVSDPKKIGEISEAMIIARLLQSNYVVCKPFGDNQRYDLVIEKDGVFLRIQCKTGRIKENVIFFPTCSINRDSHVRRSYVGDIELFAVYCHENDKVYLVPIEDCGLSAKQLRLTPTLNNQSKRISFAIDYELK